MALLVIDGVEMPAPSELKVPESDLDSQDTTRNELGILQRDRVRQGIRKIECAWKALTAEDASILLKAVKPKSVLVTYPDPEENLMVTRKMYVGDRSSELILYRQSTNEYRWKISFNLTEF